MKDYLTFGQYQGLLDKLSVKPVKCPRFDFKVLTIKIEFERLKNCTPCEIDCLMSLN